jgi:hypothetical protein
MNKIIFHIIDGTMESYVVRGGKYTSVPSRWFNVERIELDTKETLRVGDYVHYKNYSVKVVRRIYCPEGENHPVSGYFKFLCDDVYTGRSE